ncbi:MAG: hypothetical protein LBH05_04855 [Deferribacteraceae bacterium]|jgi:hypothetical protein|nr:hypothetical protein [Deferribacteraceae bacterium]
MSKEKIDKLIFGASRFRSVFHKILVYCETPKTLNMLEDAVKLDQNELFGIQVLLEWLEEAGAISFELNRDSGDEAGKDSGQAAWTTTESGLEYVREHNPDNRILKLFDEENESAVLMKQLLGFCIVPRKLSELEDEFNKHAKEKGLTVNYYLSALESAGVIKWDNGWKTEKEGEKYAVNG